MVRTQNDSFLAEPVVRLVGDGVVTVSEAVAEAADVCFAVVGEFGGRSVSISLESRSEQNGENNSNCIILMMVNKLFATPEVELLLMYKASQKYQLPSIFFWMQ